MCWRTWGKETYISFRKTTIVQHQYWTDESAQNIWRQSHIVNKMTALHNYNIIRQHILVRVRVMIFNAIFNNISAISWQSVLLVEEIKVLGENNRFVTSHSQILSNMLYLQILYEKQMNFLLMRPLVHVFYFFIFPTSLEYLQMVYHLQKYMTGTWCKMILR